MRLKYISTLSLLTTILTFSGCDATPEEESLAPVQFNSSSSSVISSLSSSSSSFSSSSIISSSSLSSSSASSEKPSCLLPGCEFDQNPIVLLPSSSSEMQSSSSQELSSSSSSSPTQMSSSSTVAVVPTSSSSSSVSNLTCTPAQTPTGIFVSTTGTSTASGTLNDPLDLATALSSSSPVQSGETIWVLGGTYNGAFTSDLRGTASQRITVRPYPYQHVKIDSNIATSGSGLRINGEYVDFYDFEVMSSDTDRESVENSSGPSDVSLLNGVNIFGAKIKVINFVVHDNSGGISSWRTGSDADSEIYGNLIYNNGWTAPGRGHGHAIYAQNNIGYKKITNNVIFFGFGTGIHIYTEGGQINNFDIRRNVWFMTGASDPRTSQQKDNCLVGGFQPVINLHVEENMGWAKRRGTRIGYGGDVSNVDATFINNYLLEDLWIAGQWNSLTFTNNTLYGDITDGNGYINDSIKAQNNFASNTPPATGNKIFIHNNEYDANRARVVIYNYDDADSVSVNLSGVLSVGDEYTIHSVYDVYGTPIISATYDGANISIPMGSVTLPQPNGLNGIADEDNPKKAFGVFLVRKGGCN